MRVRSTSVAVASLMLLGILSTGCAKKAEGESMEATHADDAARRAEDAARRCEAAVQRAETAADRADRSMAHRFRK
jgi:hypothetical protein